MARAARTSQGAEVTDDLQPTLDWTVSFIGHVIGVAWSVVAATLAVCFWDITTRHAAGSGRKEFGRRRPRARKCPITSSIVTYEYLLEPEQFSRQPAGHKSLMAKFTAASACAWLNPVALL